jgi:iron complex outermembrane receptor protein
MFRTSLLRGVSAGAVSLLLIAGAPAQAQHALPSLDVGAARRPHVAHKMNPAPAHKPVRVAAVRPAPRPAPHPAPTPVVVAAPAPKPSVWSPTLPDGKPAFVQKFALPNTVASVTRRQIEEKVNIVDTEDAVKYMPSLFVRKRNNGDTQAVLQTRTWGVASSARSLVYADDLLLTALIGNDNNIGAPRWGLVAPEEIERVDMLYGPFAAQYSGNALGGVLQITTRMPEKLEVTAKQTSSIQDFTLWGTSKAFYANETAFTIGDKINDFSWLVTGNWLHGSTQPLTYVNAASGTFPATAANLYGYPGAYFETTKFGVPATVLGSAGNLQNDQVNGKLKLAYDFTPTIRGTYILGFWSNDGTSKPENYLVSGHGPYFGPSATVGRAALGTAALQSFGAAYYRIQEKQLVNSGAVKSNTKDIWDFEVSASNFDYLQSDQRAPWSGAWPYGGYTQSGRNTVFTGTYWTMLDAKGIFRPFGYDGPHEMSFGLHGDRFHLNNPVWLTSDWTAGTAASLGTVASIGDGTTQTQALWWQDAWKISPQYKATLGVRAEHWQASDGYNQAFPALGPTGLAANTLPVNAKNLLPIYQPVLFHTRFSPKGAFQWTPDDLWTVTANIGLANRFPTAKELYNLSTVTSTGVVANPNPNLRPEVALSKELSFERKVGPDGWARVSIFDEEVRDAMITQNVFIPGTNQLAQNTTNVDRIRNSGVEVAARKENFFVKGLEVDGSFTWLNARVISDSKWAPAGGNNLDQWALSVAGKTVPNVPDLRWTLTGTYHLDDNWSFSAAARWQGRMWTTLANNDIAHGVYQSFDRFFVVDTKIRYKANDHFTFDFGIDNIGNYKYFLFHPFPQRTFVVSAKYQFGTTEKNSRGIFYTDVNPLPDWRPKAADTSWLTNFKLF